MDVRTPAFSGKTAFPRPSSEAALLNPSAFEELYDTETSERVSCLYSMIVRLPLLEDTVSPEKS